MFDLLPPASQRIDDLPNTQDGHADGGIMWPVFAAQDGNFSLFPFAKSGATCSNTLTPRVFPSVFGDELPTYFKSLSNGSLGALLLKFCDAVRHMDCGLVRLYDRSTILHGYMGSFVLSLLGCALCSAS